MRYKFAYGLSREELQKEIQQGWRRQGAVLFTPSCASCKACQSLRVATATFEPNRSQRRVIKINQGTVLEVNKPKVSVDQVALFVQHHNHHAEQKGWKTCTPHEAVEKIKRLGSSDYIEEWSYYINGKLVSVSYVDVVPEGLSGVYFYHHPGYRQYSLGTWCVISMILRGKELGIPFAYLGFYVAGCRSMEYKGRFGPAQILTPDGHWQAFQRQE
jgi:arginine-tRNA-protein transferase